MSAKSILIIDDDKELTQLLSEYLTPQGYAIQCAHDGLTGVKMATSGEHFDLILLDVMLPELDGFEVLKKIRISHLTPIMMLTAKGDDFDRIFGLELGADDYMPKPFNHRELSARIKAIIRRMEFVPSHSTHQPITIGDVNLQPVSRSVLCDNLAIEVTSTEFSILHLLMMNCGNLVSKQDISKKVLGRPLASYDRSIDMHVSNIRKKLNKINNKERIKTVRGSGYIFLGSAA
ncbi:response regulator transcription factor [Planctobacterium marinum]|uniref:DNA-binding response regulator n=1 Tax=Planctobacterium marinum TaxID=1631968 RepID=A0AA48I9E3_9ALTE|nr:DNA-binding response regulator [Planctobacterium marinum]